MTNSGNRPDAEIALLAAEAGARVIRRLYQQPLPRYAKSATDFATRADLDSEHAIRAVIRDARSDDSFVGEEGGAESGTTERCWLVDPLCGTLNYAAGTPLAAINVALSDRNRVTAAVSADPIADEYFWTDGRNAWRRHAGADSKLAPSAASRLVDINCDGTGDFLGPQLVADADLRATYGPRVLSSTLALGWVAAGRRAGYVTDGKLEGSVHFAAGIAICKAAGCVVTDLAGSDLYTGRGLIAAADRETHQDLAGFVAKHR